tara:strand:- start:2248 stop:3276 length:1029 start_codon:yes stop_codon:yes gene_type:complete
MKLLFENWRNFRKESLNEITGMGGPSEERTLDALVSLSSKMTVEQADTIRQIVSIVEPTGILSWPEFAAATKNLNDQRTMKAGGEWLLALLAIIPVLGKAAAPAKAAKLMRTTKTVTDKGKKMFDGVSDGAKMANKIDDAGKVSIEKLKIYMETTQGFGVLKRGDMNRLLKMAKEGKAVGYSGKAFRGARANNFMQLVDQLNIPGIKNRKPLDYIAYRAGKGPNPANSADYFFRKQFQEVWSQPGKWVEIKLPGSGITIAAQEGGKSFTKSWKQAERFADQTTATHGDRFEIIFQTSGDKFIDVAKTLDKNKVNVLKTFRDEEEVLAIGNIAAEKIFVRRAQ